MVQRLESPLRATLMVASDIHLVSCDDERAKFLLNMLEKIAVGDVEVLVLLGDIFDFCLGSSRYFQKKYSPIGAALTRISDSGTRVVFFEGNHEFDLPKFAWRGVEYIPEGDLIIQLSDGTKVKMAHGDMVYSSKVYQRFRTFVKSGPVRFVASNMPGRLMERFALKNAEVSRAQDEYRDLNHGLILGAADEWASRDDCDHAIFGHFHVPYADQRASGKGKLLSLYCWDKPNFLMFNDGEFTRVLLDENGVPTIEETKPVARI